MAADASSAHPILTHGNLHLWRGPTQAHLEEAGVYRYVTGEMTVLPPPTAPTITPALAAGEI